MVMFPQMHNNLFVSVTSGQLSFVIHSMSSRDVTQFYWFNPILEVAYRETVGLGTGCAWTKTTASQLNSLEKHVPCLEKVYQKQRLHQLRRRMGHSNFLSSVVTIHPQLVLDRSRLSIHYSISYCLSSSSPSTATNACSSLS